MVAILRVLCYSFLSPLAKIPSIQWCAGWTRCQTLYINYVHGIRHGHYDAHPNHAGDRHFQTIVRTAPNEVSIVTTDGIQTVFDGTFARSPWYGVVSDIRFLKVFSISSTLHNKVRSRNIFLFGPMEAHIKRRRSLASAYSKTSVTHVSVENIIRTRTSKLLQFIDEQISTENSSFGKSGPLVVRNMFRALQSDIFTTFAFSGKAGTSFLESLRRDANTMEDQGMKIVNERRDRIFFRESEAPFDYFGRVVASGGPLLHAKAQEWLSELTAKYKAMSHSGEEACPDKPLSEFNYSPYRKMFTWRNPETRQPLNWNEKASGIMDHTGSTIKVAEILLRLLTITFSSGTRRRTNSSRIYDPESECTPRSPVQTTCGAFDLTSFGRRRSYFSYD